MKLSIIIPTIRGVSQINKVLEKIICYKNINIEILIINDDPAHQISQNLVHLNSELSDLKLYENIIFINNTKNCGPGFSRNIGIERATGKYVCFLDDDDEIDLRFLASIDFENHEADIYFMRFEDSSGSFTNNDLFDVLKAEDTITLNKIITYWNSKQKLATHCQPYLFRKKFLTKENIFFPSTYIAEDMVFNTLAIVNAENISIIDCSYYKYISSNASLKSSAGINRAIDVITGIKYILNKIHIKKIDYAKKIFITNTIHFLNTLFTIRLSLLIEKQPSLNIKLNGFDNKDIAIMQNLGVKINRLLKNQIIDSEQVLNFKFLILKKLTNLGVDHNSRIYLYCCGQICEYIQEIISKNIGINIFIVDDKISLIDDKIYRIDTIKIDKNLKNYVILCNQQNWINSKIQNRLINRYHSMIDRIVLASELLG